MANMCCKRMYGEVNFSYVYRNCMYFSGFTTVIDTCSSYLSKMAIIYLVSDDKSSVVKLWTSVDSTRFWVWTSCSFVLYTSEFKWLYFLLFLIPHLTKLVFEVNMKCIFCKSDIIDSFILSVPFTKYAFCFRNADKVLHNSITSMYFVWRTYILTA
jgi:hypothetical protein